MIKALDCTLRDGGYVNHFAFGESATRQIIVNLAAAGLEFIEVGFLRNTKKDTETTVYTSVGEADALLLNGVASKKILLMIVYGQYDIDRLPDKSKCKIDGIRVTFKKDEIDEALEYITKVQEKGYMVSANPTGVHAYSDYEFLELLEKVNNHHPDIFALVDTLGLLKRSELLRLLYLVENNLDSNIALAFHAHNNLQMAFAHAQTLIEVGIKRDLIIDTSLRGMGRGAGNLCTELLLQYMNDVYDRHYNLLPILSAIDEHIDKIYADSPWGYSLPYYLAASLQCHPNYATFLTDRRTLSINDIGDILSTVPDDKKSVYDKELIQSLYLTYQENKVDDEETIEKLRKQIGTREVLLLGPGKTMYTEREQIYSYIRDHEPCIVSINYRPRHIRPDWVFVSNLRRFDELSDHTDAVITSNIKDATLPKLNYGSYLNESEYSDNALLMLLKVLIRIGVKGVRCAGLDGFSTLGSSYYQASVNLPFICEENRMNEEISGVLRRLNKQIDIRFITSTLYQL